MKIAVTYDNGEVFQHFGHSEQFKIYETDSNSILSSQVVDTNGSGHEQVKALLAGNLNYQPDTVCEHHDHAHGAGHTCGEHGCKDHGAAH